MLVRTFLAGLSLAFAVAIPAQAKVIFSDSFESPSQGGGYSYGGADAAGAVFGGGTGIQANGSAFGYANAPDGIQTAHIQSDSSFAETVTGLTAGNVFTLSFFAAARPGYSLDPFTVSYTPTSGTGSVLLSISPGSSDWLKYSTNFVSSGNGYITFAGLNSNSTGDFNVGIDGVSISTGGVPETSTWAMMLLGFGGLSLLAYRKSRNGSADFAMTVA